MESNNGTTHSYTSTDVSIFRARARVDKMSGTFLHACTRPRAHSRMKRIRGAFVVRSSLEKASRVYGASCVYSISGMPSAKESRVHGNCTKNA